jgi:hypothetical protein
MHRPIMHKVLHFQPQSKAAPAAPNFSLNTAFPVRRSGDTRINSTGRERQRPGSHVSAVRWFVSGRTPMRPTPSSQSTGPFWAVYSPLMR